MHGGMQPENQLRSVGDFDSSELVAVSRTPLQALIVNQSILYYTPSAQ